jgi:hypothetical protein
VCVKSFTCVFFAFMYVINFTLHLSHTHIHTLHLEDDLLHHHRILNVLHSTQSALDGPSRHVRQGRGCRRRRRFVRECKLLGDIRHPVMLHCTPSCLGGRIGDGSGCSGSGRGSCVGKHSCLMDIIPGETFLYIAFEIQEYN